MRNHDDFKLMIHMINFNMLNEMIHENFQQEVNMLILMTFVKVHHIIGTWTYDSLTDNIDEYIKIGNNIG